MVVLTPHRRGIGLAQSRPLGAEPIEPGVDLRTIRKPGEVLLQLIGRGEDLERLESAVEQRLPSACGDVLRGADEHRGSHHALGDALKRDLPVLREHLVERRELGLGLDASHLSSTEFVQRPRRVSSEQTDATVHFIETAFVLGVLGLAVGVLVERAESEEDLLHEQPVTLGPRLRLGRLADADQLDDARLVEHRVPVVRERLQLDRRGEGVGQVVFCKGVLNLLRGGLSAFGAILVGRGRMRLASGEGVAQIGHETGIGPHRDVPEKGRDRGVVTVERRIALALGSAANEVTVVAATCGGSDGTPATSPPVNAIAPAITRLERTRENDE